MRWIWDRAKYRNSHSSKSIKVTKLFFCQNGVLLGRSFWPKDSLVTLILFELWLLWYLAQSQIHRINLYFKSLQKSVISISFPRISISLTKNHYQKDSAEFWCRKMFLNAAEMVLDDSQHAFDQWSKRLTWNSNLKCFLRSVSSFQSPFGI